MAAIHTKDPAVMIRQTGTPRLILPHGEAFEDEHRQP